MPADSESAASAKATHRKALSVVLLIEYIGVPLIGLAAMALAAWAGFPLPVEVDSYNAAQLAGFIALGVVATACFLVIPWVMAVRLLRRDPSTPQKAS